MQKFMLQENVRLFKKRLLEDRCDDEKAYLSAQIIALRRELALLNVGSQGTQSYPTEFGRLTPQDRMLFQRMVENTSQPSIIIDPRVGFHIIDLNDAYEAATLTDRNKVAGEGMFEVFPDNPDLDDADGVANLFESIQSATQTRVTHAMAIQRYDVRDPSGHFVARYWQPRNIPILNGDGQVVCILHQAEDVTDTYARITP